MKKYAYRWECANGNSAFSQNASREYGYVFITMKSALMWLQDLGWGYDNPTKSDLVLYLCEVDECYPVFERMDSGTLTLSNGIADWCSEYRARIIDKTPIAYMCYNDIKLFGKALGKCKSQKAIKAYCGLDPAYDLRCDDVLSFSYIGTMWVRDEQTNKHSKEVNNG